jgi:hypothetical protein
MYKENVHLKTAEYAKKFNDGFYIDFFHRPRRSRRRERRV